MKMRKVENFGEKFCEDGENSACKAPLAAENSAYLAPQKRSAPPKTAAQNKTPEDEKFILEYGESLAEGDLRPILLENYNAPK